MDTVQDRTEANRGKRAWNILIQSFFLTFRHLPTFWCCGEDVHGLYKVRNVCAMSNLPFWCHCHKWVTVHLAGKGRHNCPQTVARNLSLWTHLFWDSQYAHVTEKLFLYLFFVYTLGTVTLICFRYSEARCQIWFISIFGPSDPVRACIEFYQSNYDSSH